MSVEKVYYKSRLTSWNGSFLPITFCTNYFDTVPLEHEHDPYISTSPVDYSVVGDVGGTASNESSSESHSSEEEGGGGGSANMAGKHRRYIIGNILYTTCPNRVQGVSKK